MAFMFESMYICKLTQFGAEAPKDENYSKCWQGFPNNFRQLQQQKK
jgi:homogentisate 1,2-dioxygenase